MSDQRSVILPPALGALAAVAAQPLDLETWERHGGAFPGILGVRVTAGPDGMHTLEGTDGQMAVRVTEDAPPIVPAGEPGAQLPDVAAMLPAGAPLARIQVDVRRLQALVQAAAAVCGGNHLHAVSLAIYPDPAAPLVIRGPSVWASCKGGGEFIGLLLPQVPNNG